MRKSGLSSLREKSSVSNVDNIVLFISDTLRYDHIPKYITKLGVSSKAISPSTGTKSSLPSITSGQYPSSHGIWSIYNNKFKNSPILIDFENFGYNAETSWHHLESQNKPPLKVHNLHEETKFNELREPFVYIEHDKGPHAPYDKLHSEMSKKEFFNRNSGNLNELKNMYKELVDESCERFLNLYNDIKDRGILEDTLIIFTSDHGELLGEPRYGHSFLHGHPLVPELVLVPIVFIGAGLPEGEYSDVILSGTDIAPTCLSAQNRSFNNMDGTNLWDGEISLNRIVFSELYSSIDNKSLGNIPLYDSTGAFSYSGGYVYNSIKSAQGYGLGLLNKFKRSPTSHLSRSHSDLRNSLSLANAYRPGIVKYGNPSMSKDEARTAIKNFRDR